MVSLFYEMTAQIKPEMQMHHDAGGGNARAGQL